MRSRGLGRLKPFLKEKNEVLFGLLSEVSLSGFFWDLRTVGSIAGGMSQLEKSVNCVSDRMKGDRG